MYFSVVFVYCADQFFNFRGKAFFSCNVSRFVFVVHDELEYE